MKSSLQVPLKPNSNWTRFSENKIRELYFVLEVELLYFSSVSRCETLMRFSYNKSLTPRPSFHRVCLLCSIASSPALAYWAVLDWVWTRLGAIKISAACGNKSPVHSCFVINTFPNSSHYYPLSRFLKRFISLWIQGKAFPIQSWAGPDRSRSLRFPNLKTIGTRMW
jgi:hypothetical protein